MFRSCWFFHFWASSCGSSVCCLIPGLNPGTPGDRSGLLALVYLIPNFVLSVLLTKVATAPFKKFMRKLNEKEEAQEPVVGRQAVVASAEVSTDFGRVEIQTKDVPIALNARVSEGSARLKKGDHVLIIDHDKDKDTYLVKEFKAIKLEN